MRQRQDMSHMKENLMNANRCCHGLRAVVLIAAMAAAAVSSAQDRKERDPREFAYVQVAGGMALSSSADLNVGLGGRVRLPGEATYGSGGLLGLTLGYQFLREEDRKPQASAAGGKQKEPQPWRAELELWNAAVTRDSIRVGTESVHPKDRIQPRVLFVNLAMPISESEERYASKDPKRPPQPLWRTWLGAGIGLAHLSYPNASALSGCNCLREASGSGAAFQVKLQAERQIGEDTYLFGQIGRVWLPSVTATQGAQSTEYGRWGVNNLQLGVRWVFRD